MSAKQNLGQESIPGSVWSEADTQKILADNDWDGKTIGEVLDKIARIDDDNMQKGREFERLTQLALPLIKALEIKSVIKPSGRDLGVDLIATANSGERIGIQCKFYTQRNITLKSIAHIQAAGELKNVDEMWLVCGAKGLASEAQQYINKAGMTIIDLRQYAKVVLSVKKPEPRVLKKLQQEAHDAVLQGFGGGAERGQLIMACGTGKTFTSLRIAEEIAPHNANLLFIAPSIALVAQARNEWLDHSTRQMVALVICSDSGAGDSEDIKPNEITGKVTTDPKQIAETLKKKIPEAAARVTFCTYQSLDKLLIAQAEHGAPDFDLAIVDEAHRTTGLLDESKSGQFQIILDKEKIQADKRLFMTATPRIYKESKSRKNSDAVVVDMNSYEQYGHPFHHLTFKNAVNADALCDYRVIALGVSENMIDSRLVSSLISLNDDLELSGKSGKGKAADDQSVLALCAISLAINGFVKGDKNPGVIERTIVYANNIRRSKWLQQALNKQEMKTWITKHSRAQNADADKALAIDAKHLDGTSNLVARTNALRELNDASNAQNPHLITNCKLFTEGVDVPALNAIAFLDPRDSKVDTVQAVGRVMRKDPNNLDKKFGYIIVPVILPNGKDLLETLEEDQSRFKSLGNVLRALQSHDERLYTELPNHLSMIEAKRSGDSDPAPAIDPPPIQQSLLDENALQAIHALIASYTGLARPGKQIADAITQAIEIAARIFEAEGVTKVIADTIGTPADNIKESCKTAALLIANACIMHKRLEETGNLGGLTRLQFASNEPHPISALSAAWKTILQKDYAPIFSDATALLERLPDNQQIRSAIRTLTGCAISQATVLNDLGFDHAGPLYHRILGSAKSDGAFYTKNLSAYLLAGLAFDDNFTDWKDLKAVQKLRVADPACGTGTLLMAALKAIKDKAAKAQNLTADQTEDLHKHLVENTFYGFDINKYSIQLAACNLTIGAPNTDYAGMNLHTLHHGPRPGTAGSMVQDVRHGALEMLLGITAMKQLELKIADADGSVYGTNAERIEGEVTVPENLDAVIYNPPFSDTTKASTRFNAATKRAMDHRLKHINTYLANKDRAAHKAIAKQSIRPYFTPIAHQLLSPVKGTMAEIIPTTFCTSENGREERKYIAARHHIDIVITCHDTKRFNFSENTAIHESLIIARRSENKNQPTRFIQLAEYPTDVAAVEALVVAIQSGEPSDLFTTTLWSREKVAAGNWTPCQWMNPKLAEVADEMNTPAFMANTVLSGDVYKWGPVGRAIRGSFDYERSDAGDIFCTIDESLMQTIQAKPESKATPKKGKEAQAEKLWQQADYALVPTRFSTTSSRVLAVYSDKPALGSAFCPIGIYDKQTAKAMVAFLNSSFGIIQMLNRRTKKLTYPAYEAGHYRTLRLPAADDLSPLLEAFEKVKSTPLGRLSECENDAARKILDHAAAKVIGIHLETTDQWRQWLAVEPTINNRNYRTR